MLPTEEPTSQPTQVQSHSLIPSSKLSHTPSISSMPSSNQCTSFQPIMLVPPSSVPTVMSAPTRLLVEMHGQIDVNNDLPCITVKTWGNFIQTLATKNGELLFCLFLLTKIVQESAIIDKDLWLICVRHLPMESCTMYCMLELSKSDLQLPLGLYCMYT